MTDQEPKFKHERVWVVCMWIGITVFALWYWRHPEIMDLIAGRH